jgi:hypothetical protein
VRGRNQLHHQTAKKGRRNRPVLRWADGTYITIKEARQLGFASMVLYTGAFLKDVTAFEEMLHRPLGSGFGDVWRRVLNGPMNRMRVGSIWYF